MPASSRHALRGPSTASRICRSMFATLCFEEASLISRPQTRNPLVSAIRGGKSTTTQRPHARPSCMAPSAALASFAALCARLVMRLTSLSLNSNHPVRPSIWPVENRATDDSSEAPSPPCVAPMLLTGDCWLCLSASVCLLKNSHSSAVICPRATNSALDKLLNVSQDPGCRNCSGLCDRGALRSISSASCW